MVQSADSIAREACEPAVCGEQRQHILYILAKNPQAPLAIFTLIPFLLVFPSTNSPKIRIVLQSKSMQVTHSPENCTRAS